MTAPTTPTQLAIVAEGERLKAMLRDPATLTRMLLELDETTEMLLAKNASYGNSATDPLRCFSKAAPEEQILVRIDDKLSRIARGQSAGEDVIADLIGYLVLLRVQRGLARCGG